MAVVSELGQTIITDFLRRQARPHVDTIVPASPDGFRCGCAQRLCQEGAVRLGHRLCDGWLRSPHSRLHAGRHPQRAGIERPASRLALHFHVTGRGHRRHRLRHRERLFQPRAGAELDHFPVRGLHRSQYRLARLLRPSDLPHCRRARTRGRVRHRHGAGRRGLAGDRFSWSGRSVPRSWSWYFRG